jgi:short-subunit dehydrogenase
VRAGWNVLGVGRRAARLAELTELLRGATGNLATLALDLRDTGAPARIVREAQERFGRIDVLVNNAGGVAVGPITNQSDDALYEQFETHAIVPLALTREAIPALRATKGHVFYVGSGVARIPVGTLGAYPPAKAAVRSIARIARNELRADGIAVTYIDPGAVATEFMTRAGFAGPPKGVAASPQEVARRIFLAFTSRRPVVNAVPWQTFFVGIGEALPALTDALLRRAPQLVGGSADVTAELPGSVTFELVTTPAEEEEPPKIVAPIEPVMKTALPAAQATPPSNSPAFDAALAQVAVRMQKLKLGAPFVRNLLVPGANLELGDVAMRWAGMPNKNERAVMREVFEALTESGFLERNGEDRYVVLRAP